MKLTSKKNGRIFVSVLMTTIMGAFSFTGCKKSDSDDPVAASSSTSSSSTSTGTSTAKASSVDDAVIEAETSELQLAGSLSLVTASEESGASLRLNGDDLPATSAFKTDKVSKYVHDDSMDALSLAGNILCLFSQTAYTEMEGKGDYMAQVDMDSCFNKGQNESSGQSAGGGTTSLSNMVLNSSRATKTSPLIVKSWFPVTDDHPQMIYITIKIAEGASDENPFGIFRLNWNGFELDPDTYEVGAESQMHGILESKRGTGGQLQISLYEDEGTRGGKAGSAYVEAEEVNGKIKIVSGVAQTRSESRGDHGSEISNFKLAFDQEYFLAKETEANETKCLDRKNFNASVWRYGVYNADDGSRLEINSGFPLTFESAGKRDEHGWIGYWGLWKPESVSLSNGDTVYRVEHNNGTETKTPYTIAMSEGKLIKYSQSTIALSDLDGSTFTDWNNGQEVRLVYNHSEKKFYKTGVYSQQNQEFTDVTATEYTSQWGGHNYWSGELGGRVNFPYNNNTWSASTDATYYTEENVTATAGNLTLYCYKDCMRTAITSAQLAETAGSSPYFDNASSVGSPYTYTYDGTNMVLKYSGTSVTLGSGVSASQSSRFSWGIQSGALVTSTSGMSSVNENEGASVFYKWETGANSHNKFTGVKDSTGAFLSFDRPLNVTYKHTKDNDYVGADSSDFYGKTFRLDINGPTEMHGIPHKKAEDSNRWEAAFALKEGSEINSDYIVKPLDLEQSMAEALESKCSDLSITGVPDLPTGTNYEDPLSIMEEVAPEDAPILVIKGVVQE